MVQHSRLLTLSSVPRSFILRNKRIDIVIAEFFTRDPLGGKSRVDMAVVVHRGHGRTLASAETRQLVGVFRMTCCFRCERRYHEVLRGYLWDRAVSGWPCDAGEGTVKSVTLPLAAFRAETT